jgi:hypothetical protein
MRRFTVVVAQPTKLTTVVAAVAASMIWMVAVGRRL